MFGVHVMPMSIQFHLKFILFCDKWTQDRSRFEVDPNVLARWSSGVQPVFLRRSRSQSRMLPSPEMRNRYSQCMIVLAVLSFSGSIFFCFRFLDSCFGPI